MKTLTKEKLKDHLVNELKVESDSVVFLFSALWGLGRIEGGLDCITDSFREVLPDGLLIIPTFSYSWAKGESYDPSSSDCPDMGNYPNYAYKQKEFSRTSDPNFSVAMLRTNKNSQLVDELTQIDRDCFGENSVFSKLYNKSKLEGLKVYVILLGGAFNDCLFRCTFFHFVQQKCNVPYRYIKKFYDPLGEERKPLRQYSRYLSLEEYQQENNGKVADFKLPAIEDFSQFGELAKSKGLLTIRELNYYPTRMMSVLTLCDLFEEQLVKNPLCYLK